MSSRIATVFAGLIAVFFIGYFASPLRPWPASAANITVHTLIDVDAVDGLCSLREAIIAANTNAAYKECAAGTGTDTISFSVGGSIMLTSDLPSITDASGLTVNGAGTINGGGAWRSFSIAGTGVLILQNLILFNNFGLSAGAINNNGGTVTVLNSTIAGNNATGSFPFGSGGGIRNDGAMTLSNSIVNGNSAPTNGGGIINSGTLTLINSIVSNNTTAAGGSGGGIYSTGNLTLNNSRVTGNSATDSAGIFNNGNLTLTDSTVSGNTASQNAGGIFNEDNGTLTLTNSTVSGNSAPTSGGGIRNDGNMTVTNSTISGNTNTNGSGGGIINLGTAMLTNVTITGNSSPFGGGIFQGATSGAPASLFTTILANNTSANCSGPINTLGYNLASDLTCSLNPALNDLPNNANANLGPLANNGGPTQTHALLTGSAAIDTGSPGCPPPNTDQRGITRPQDGNGDSIARCDIGAYELQAVATPTVTATATGTRTATPTGTVPATATATRTPTPIIIQRPPALGAFPLAGATGTERNLARAAAEAQAAAAAQAQAGLAPDPRAAVGPSLLRPPNTGDGGLVRAIGCQLSAICGEMTE